MLTFRDGLELARLQKLASDIQAQIAATRADPDPDPDLERRLLSGALIQPPPATATPAAATTPASTEEALAEAFKNL